MPNTKSAKKALRQTIRRRKLNIGQQKKLKETIKEYKKVVETEDVKKATEKLPAVFKALDKAAKVNLIKKSKADRLKSRLSKKIKKTTATA
ncbi:MAG: 30S ribosomal protein S20 [bacterium]